MQALTYLLITEFHALLWNRPIPEKRILLCAAAGRQPAAAGAQQQSLSVLARRVTTSSPLTPSTELISLSSVPNGTYKIE
jgi:hypothetical protein